MFIDEVNVSGIEINDSGLAVVGNCRTGSLLAKPRQLRNILILIVEGFIVEAGGDLKALRRRVDPFERP
jgi:hypothetical protein